MWLRIVGLMGAVDSTPYATIVKIDPRTWKAEMVSNKFKGMPVTGCNDFDVDHNGNIWVGDSMSAWVSNTTSKFPTSPTG